MPEPLLQKHRRSGPRSKGNSLELNNSFIVNRPIDEAWEILTDLERLAPCMPGAQLTEIEGDEYRGVVKVKVGPIVANYQGTAKFASLDAENRVATIKAEGRDRRQGNADAEITATLTANGRSATWVKLKTDLSLSGKFAGFGKSAIEDVSANLLGQFAEKLEAMLSEDDVHEGDTPDASPEPQPVDLGAVAGELMMERLAPFLFALGLVMLIWLLLRRRRRSRS